MPTGVYPRTEEHSRKLKIARAGRKPALAKRWKLSQETRKKMSLAQMGNTHSKGVVRSLDFKRKLSEANKGENGTNWRGGINPINLKIRGSLEYRIWRESVFNRDNWTCVWCGVRSAKNISVELNADHIKPFASYPELRFSLENGRTLCKPCHKKTPTYGNRKN